MKGRCGSCHELPSRPGQRYCIGCHARWMREHRTKPGDMTPEQRVRIRARRLANHALAAGKIKKQKCLRCPSRKTEMHHTDYAKPLNVTWLCRPCHLEIHRREALAPRP